MKKVICLFTVLLPLSLLAQVKVTNSSASSAIQMFTIPASETVVVKEGTTENWEVKKGNQKILVYFWKDGNTQSIRKEINLTNQLVVDDIFLGIAQPTPPPAVIPEANNATGYYNQKPAEKPQQTVSEGGKIPARLVNLTGKDSISFYVTSSDDFAGVSLAPGDTSEVKMISSGLLKLTVGYFNNIESIKKTNRDITQAVFSKIIPSQIKSEVLYIILKKEDLATQEMPKKIKIRMRNNTGYKIAFTGPEKWVNKAIADGKFSEKEEVSTGKYSFSFVYYTKEGILMQVDAQTIIAPNDREINIVLGSSGYVETVAKRR